MRALPLTCSGGRGPPPEAAATLWSVRCALTLSVVTSDCNVAVLRAPAKPPGPECQGRHWLQAQGRGRSPGSRRERPDGSAFLVGAENVEARPRGAAVGDGVLTVRQMAAEAVGLSESVCPLALHIAVPLLKMLQRVPNVQEGNPTHWASHPEPVDCPTRSVGSGGVMGQEGGSEPEGAGGEWSQRWVSGAGQSGWVHGGSPEL